MTKLEFYDDNLGYFILHSNSAKYIFDTIRADRLLDFHIVDFSLSVDADAILFSRLGGVDFNFDELYDISCSIVKITEFQVVDFAELLTNCVLHSKRQIEYQVYVFSKEKRLDFFINVISRNHLSIAPVSLEYIGMVNLFQGMESYFKSNLQYDVRIVSEDTKYFISFNINEQILNIVNSLASFILLSELVDIDESKVISLNLSNSFLKKFFHLSIELFHKRKNEISIHLRDGIIESINDLESVLNNFIEGKILLEEDLLIISNALAKKGVFAGIPDYIYNSLSPIKQGFSDNDVMHLLTHNKL